MTTQAIARPPLRYYGGKWNLGPWIIGHFPPHICYVEPFGGGASVLLQKPPSALETYNDLDGEVVNFFRVLREQPAALLRAVELTPWARAEYELSQESTDDPLESARRFFVRSWQSVGGPVTKWRNGWRYQIRGENIWRASVETWSRLDHLHAVARRLRCVQLEQRDAFDLIPRYDTPATLFYLDPPYVWGTRSKWRSNAYRYELDDNDHARIAELLYGLQGMVVLSGYPSPLYEQLFDARGWLRLETRAHVNSRGMVRTEGLWLSPRTLERLEQTGWLHAMRLPLDEDEQQP